MYKLNWEKTRIKRQIKFQRIGIKFHDIIGFEIISKISVSLKDNDCIITEIYGRYFTWKFPRFWEVILDGGFQNYSSRQVDVQIWH